MIIYYIAEENIFEAFRKKEKLKCRIKDCFKINSKETMKMLQKDGYIKSKNFERKTNSSFMIYENFKDKMIKLVA